MALRPVPKMSAMKPVKTVKQTKAMKAIKVMNADKAMKGKKAAAMKKAMKKVSNFYTVIKDDGKKVFNKKHTIQQI